MAKLISLRFGAHCADCGASLYPGDLASWHGKGVVYGIHCHTFNRRDPSNPAADPGIRIKLGRLQGEVIA